MAGSRNRRIVTLLALAAVAGAIAGVLAVYFMAAGNGNPAVAVGCAPSAPVVKAMAPLAVGEVAAFQVADPPEKLDELSFKGPDGTGLTLAAFAGKTVLV